MEVIRYKKQLQDAIHSYRRDKKAIGLVPTMGALHQGHLSLVRSALEENAVTVVSIFVNPTQFDNPEDLENYPKTLERDVQLLESLSGNLLVFTPSKSEIYNGNITSLSYYFDGLDKVMEGTFRKDHFNGVATIVELLFKTVAPNKAYFGEKDFQQLQIVRKLVQQQALPITIIACPIDRESNGLARSSRNERLSKSTRAEAGLIFSTLQTAKDKFGTENANDIKEWAISSFKRNSTFELEYFEIADEETLTPLKEKQKNIKYRAFIAVYADGVRLIDNIALN